MSVDGVRDRAMSANDSEPAPPQRGVLRRYGPRLAIGVAVGALIVLLPTWLLLRSFGSDDEAMLAAMKRDPIASYRPLGLDPVRRLENPPGTAMGGPSVGDVVTSFEVPGAEGERAYDGALRAARRAGWTLEELEPSRISPPVVATAYGSKERSEVPNFHLTISLVDGEAQFATTPATPTTDELTLQLTALPLVD